MHTDVTIIGAGLAGSEAAWQAARCGLRVKLVEMRPVQSTGAHKTPYAAELVCSNSLGSSLTDRPTGLLSEELARLGSLLVAMARRHSVAAGGALAVDRDRFAEGVQEALDQHPLIKIEHREATRLPDSPAVLASGPLTSPALSRALSAWAGQQHLFFFDALAPIVSADSLDRSKVFAASRYGRGQSEEGDYLNVPLNKEEYRRFVAELTAAERIPLKSFEGTIDEGVSAGSGYFEGCLPVEVLATRSAEALAYGPMRPVGLKDPRTGRTPFAVVQLRRDNVAGSLYNLVGFQTNLKFGEQQRVLRMLPGLEQAEFVRYGQMHRNTFLCSPRLLRPTMETRIQPACYVAGQLTGVEGYLGNVATGWLAGQNVARQLLNQPLLCPPPRTMFGALCRYISNADSEHFQPMKANFGLLPELTNPPKGKRERARALADRSLDDLADWCQKSNLPDGFSTL